MKPAEYVAFGKYLKKIRSKQGHSLDNIADENISSATISKLERGTLGVSEEKIQYLCKKLNIDFSQYPVLLNEKVDNQNKLLRTLKGIERLLNYIGSEFPIERFDSISIDVEDALYLYFLYLKGRYYYKQNMWVKSREYFLEVLQLLKQHPDYEKSNIGSYCYKELGRISYFYEGDTEKALYLNKQGLAIFHPDGERAFLKYTLLVTEAFYLEKLNRNGEASHALNILFEEETQIDNSDVRINMYEIRAFLLVKDQHYREARKYVERGVELAEANKQIDRGFELWTSLGNICFQKGDFQEAEEYFLLALDLKNFVKKEYLLVSTYTQLGRLYLKQCKWNLAKEYFETAVQIGLDSNDESRYIDALEAMGDYCLKRGDLEEATKPYEEALKLAEKHGFLITTNRCLVKLGHCYKKINPSKYQECIEKSFKITVKSTLDSLLA
ncbi:tetratricopeptide repeat protein [Shimazuella sp. AN120528]|uniref:helix-turn-helix domain-containing protein n=1 Tax=Shimazuella soli TaxID=1892854 RepID=UPI001F0DDFC7|nr:tetratricopeptide repeat protein [Shimazuella soli]